MNVELVTCVMIQNSETSEILVYDEHKDKYKWHSDTFDWKINPWAALPQCLCLCSQ